jgi:hypothetical protein
MFFDSANWYWFVGGDETRAYQSRTNTYVPAADPEFVEWLAAGDVHQPARIGTEAEIWPYVKEPPLSRSSWLFNGTTFAQPTPDTYTTDQLIGAAKEERWLNETGGIMVNLIPVETDDRSKGLVSQQRLVALKDPTLFSTTWQSVDNTLHPITGDQMITLADAVAAHVNQCYLDYAAAVAAIEGGVILNVEGVREKLRVRREGFLDLTRKRRRR